MNIISLYTSVKSMRSSESTVTVKSLCRALEMVLMICGRLEASAARQARYQ